MPERVFELRPIVSEEFPDQLHKPPLRISSAELAELRRNPLATGEAQIPPGEERRRYFLRRTSEGTYLLTIITDD